MALLKWRSHNWNTRKGEEVSCASAVACSVLSQSARPQSSLTVSQGKIYKTVPSKDTFGMTGLNQQTERYWCVNQREAIGLWAPCLVQGAFDFEMRKLTLCAILLRSVGTLHTQTAQDLQIFGLAFFFHTLISSSFNSFPDLLHYIFILHFVLSAH